MISVFLDVIFVGMSAVTPTDPSPRPLPPIVLLVENDSTARQRYAEAFAGDGLWVAESSDVREATQYASELRPDVVVTELSFGREALEGVGLVEELRRRPGTADIPVVGLGGTEVSVLGQQWTVFAAIVRKPVAVDALLRDVRSVLEAAHQLRARGERARQRVPELLSRSAQLIQRSEVILARTDELGTARPCPRCGAGLRWVERRRVNGMGFDYYELCPQGCGLFCFNPALKRFVPLIE